MKCVYIASPYTHGDVAKNVAVQMEAAHRIMDLGHCPITPILSHFLHIHRQRPYEEWCNVDAELVKRSDAVLRLPGLSPGADNEATVAVFCGIEVFYTWESLEEFLGSP